MRPQITIVPALLASSVASAPTPAVVGDLLSALGNVIGTVVQDTSAGLNTLLNQVGVVLHSNAATKHGSITQYHDQCPFEISTVVAGPTRFSPIINWPKGVNGGNYINWKTYKANGANLGGWLAKEKTHDPEWFNSLDSTAPDEWTLCGNLGAKCGPALEARYASFLNTSTIDKLASVGVNTLRIPTTYAAWIKVPGSQFYSGNQQKYLSIITKYAIEKYGMHVIVGLHSLPGGVNSLDIGEALNHGDWFQNATNLDYSFKAVDEVLKFIKNSGHQNAFTLAPINEASDTHFAGFGSPAGLTDAGSNWVLTYIDGVFKKVEKLDKRIPVMLQDNFKGPDYWAPFFDTSKNLVIDSHVYYFAAAGTYAQYVAPTVCGQSAYLKTASTKFPTFVGEWSLQTKYNNTFAARKLLFDTQRYAWQKDLAGGAFWTAVTYTMDKVDGEGVQQDYWGYTTLIDAGVITKQTNESYCN